MSETKTKKTEEKTEEEVSKEERIWVPLDELKMYLSSLTMGLLHMVSNIETTVKTIEENSTKGDTSDDDKD